jgi:hypothetical protein
MLRSRPTCGGYFNQNRRFKKESNMRAKIQGLSQVSERVPLAEGLYRARVVRFEFAKHSPKPCRTATFVILDPSHYLGRHVRTRLYLHERALWKLRWFLLDFGYDSELFNADELDDRRVLGLEGVIRLAYWGTDGQKRLDVEGFAPVSRWDELSRQSTCAPTAAATSV